MSVAGEEEGAVSVGAPAPVSAASLPWVKELLEREEGVLAAAKKATTIRGSAEPRTKSNIFNTLADATELASSVQPPPEVIDGYLLAELVDLPEEAQRAVLSGDAEGDAEGFARAPLPVEATMELVMRVMEAL